MLCKIIKIYRKLPVRPNCRCGTPTCSQIGLDLAQRYGWSALPAVVSLAWTCGEPHRQMPRR